MDAESVERISVPCEHMNKRSEEHRTDLAARPFQESEPGPADRRRQDAVDGPPTASTHRHDPKCGNNMEDRRPGNQGRGVGQSKNGDSSGRYPPYMYRPSCTTALGATGMIHYWNCETGNLVSAVMKHLSGSEQVEFWRLENKDTGPHEPVHDDGRVMTRWMTPEENRQFCAEIARIPGCAWMAVDQTRSAWREAGYAQEEAFNYGVEPVPRNVCYPSYVPGWHQQYWPRWYR
ncbi:unnamed protein product [Cyclocybe aegerita]|uniref:Uncharacterized protein n=1 Tax=Cyclocybe aegerita TaxID=1973307 RepID=A0A8S0W0N0_CYCAE|nr:unnamed protein product [Cyclocybe aegerita]